MSITDRLEMSVCLRFAAMRAKNEEFKRVLVNKSVAVAKNPFRPILIDPPVAKVDFTPDPVDARDMPPSVVWICVGLIVVALAAVIWG